MDALHWRVIWYYGKKKMIDSLSSSGINNSIHCCCSYIFYSSNALEGAPAFCLCMESLNSVTAPDLPDQKELCKLFYVFHVHVKWLHTIDNLQHVQLENNATSSGRDNTKKKYELHQLQRPAVHWFFFLSQGKNEFIHHWDGKVLETCLDTYLK